MIKLGYQIPFFDYPGVAVEQLFDTVAAQAQAAPPTRHSPPRPTPSADSSSSGGGRTAPDTRWPPQARSATGSTAPASMASPPMAGLSPAPVREQASQL